MHFFWLRFRKGRKGKIIVQEETMHDMNRLMLFATPRTRSCAFYNTPRQLLQLGGFGLCNGVFEFCKKTTLMIRYILNNFVWHDIVKGNVLHEFKKKKTQRHALLPPSSCRACSLVI